MYKPVQTPSARPPLEERFKPYGSTVPGAWNDKDGEQVRVADPDSVDLDGRSAVPGRSALNNLGAMAGTAAAALLPDKTVNRLLASLDARQGIGKVAGSVLAGIALDAWDVAKAPFKLVKDGLQAAKWGAVAASRAVGLTRPPEGWPRVSSSPPSLERVHLRTKEQGRSGYFQYALKEGRLWTKWDPVLPDKPISIACGDEVTEEQGQAMAATGRGPYDFSYDHESNRFVAAPKPDADRLGFKMVAGQLEPAPREEATSWHLHDGLGGPNLPPGEHLVEIQVQGDFVEARSNTGKMYSYDPTKPHPVVWKAEEGCPFVQDVYLPEGIRDWTLGEAVAAKPARSCIKAMNPYTDIVGYFDDAQGSKGAFGFTATTAVLMGNGREVRYRDTGLPADFARGFLTPHHGRFVGEKLAGAGGTWLLFGREPDGAPGLYSRMYDYEINGDCPGRRYTYDRPDFEQGRVYTLGGQTQMLPVPPWDRIEFPPLAGQAMVTDHVDLRLTGEGNDSREIRIEGRDATGATGYYHKGIAEKDWQFTVTGDPLVGQPVPVGQADPARATPDRVTWDYDRARWSGALEGAPIRGIELLDFHPYQTQDQPSVARFTLDSGKTVDVLLRTGDAYTMYTARPQDTELFGQGVGLAKPLIGTLDVPQEVLESQDPEIRAFVDGYLGQMHHRENEVMVLAERDELRLRTGWYHRNSDSRMDWEKNPRIDVTFSRDARGETPYEKRALDSGLRPAAGMSQADLAGVVERNRSLEAELTADLEARQKHHKIRWMRALGTEAAITALAWGASAANVTGTVGHAAEITQLMPPLMDVHTKADARAARTVPSGYTRAVETLRKNIADAEALLAGR